MNGSGVGVAFKLAMAVATLFCVAVLGYLTGIRQAGATAGGPQKTYEINLWKLHLVLSVGAMGVAVIFALAVLFSAAALFMVIARRRRMRADRTGLELKAESMQRQRAEVALHESHENLRAIFETALDAIITMDHEGKITEFNPSAERIFGYRRNEVIGRPLADLIIPEDMRDHHRNGLAHYLATGNAPVLGKLIEMTGLRANGSLIDLEMSIHRMPGDGPPMFAGFLSDITERKLAERKLEAQVARLDLLSRTTRAISERQDLESILQVVVRSLEDYLPIDFGCVCICDPTRTSLTVARVGVKTQRLALELTTPDEARFEIDRNGLSRCVEGQLVYEPNISQLDFPVPQRLARVGLRSLVLAPLPVERTTFGVLVAARRDVDGFSSGDCEFLRQLSEHVGLAAHQAQLYTELNRAYDDLRQTQEATMQQERLRALGQMASGIAHDINNALSPVPLYTQSLLAHEPDLSERARDYLTTIGHSIDDVTATLARMKEFYRQREPQLALTTVDLNHLVKQVSELTRARWSDMPQQRGFVIEMSTELASDLPRIMGVENEIRDAITNLIFNAVDAMPEGGKLRIRTSVAEAPAVLEAGSALRHVQLEVLDTGLGMDEKTQRRCLEPFFTTKGDRGTGLGLAMVYGMVKRHGADMQIDSAVGQGTTVRLRFRKPETITTQPCQTDLPQMVPRLRILVIDDDPVLLRALRNTLEDEGHSVVTANGGQAGIDLFVASLTNNQPFAVVVTDLGMPHVDGRKVAAAVKAAPSAPPVILLTGWGQRLVAEGETPQHVDCLLNKPLQLAELRKALVRLCHAPESEMVSKVNENAQR